MKLKLTFITIAGSVLLSINHVKAQSNAVTYTQPQLQAAEKFLIATGINIKFEEITNNIVQAFSAQMPENNRAAFIGVMQKFMHKYYTWDTLKGDLSKIYAAEFTEDELSQMTAFFNTPVGKKYSDKLVTLTQKGMALGQQVIKDHQAELEQMIKDVTDNKN